MRSMVQTVPMAICLSALACSRLVAQAQPAAKTGAFPLSVGAGLSDYDVDWGHGRMLGGTVWLDFQPPKLPAWLNGLGAEIEARDISLNHSPSQPSNYREDTLGGGAIYTVNRYRSFRPYGKFLASFGSMDFRTSNPGYSHETRTVYAPGGGIEVKVYRGFWARADYEYQVWPQLQGGTADPQGFTVGFMVDLRDVRRP